MANISELIKDFFSDDFNSVFQMTGAKPSLETIFQFYKENSSLESGPWIAGGVGRQLAIGETDFNDIDFWFNNPEQLAKFKTAFTDYFGNYAYQTFETANAETWQLEDFKVQFIKRNFYDTVDDVLDNFDFTCCQVAVTPEMKIYGPGIEYARAMVLSVHKLDRKGFLARYGKYVSYGYAMDPAEFINIISTEEINYEFDGASFGY